MHVPALKYRINYVEPVKNHFHMLTKSLCVACSTTRTPVTIAKTEILSTRQRHDRNYICLSSYNYVSSDSNICTTKSNWSDVYAITSHYIYASITHTIHCLCKRCRRICVQGTKTKASSYCCFFVALSFIIGKCSGSKRLCLFL